MRLTMCLRVASFSIILMLCSIRCSAQQTAETARERTPVQPRILSAEELFKQVSPSIFVVQSLDASQRPIEQGSAVVIGKGLLETNYHVIKDGATFEIFQGSKKWHADLVATNPEHDLAELKVDKLAAPNIRIRPSSTLSIGEQVYAIGAPEGLELTISQGLISGLRRVGDGLTIQTSAAISPGSSGGGLFDSEGRLVGITTAYLKEGENLNFALPAEWMSSAHSAAEWAELGSKEYQAAANYGKRDKSEEAKQAYKEAADDYAQTVRLDPTNEEAWRRLGDVSGASDTRVRAYKEALRLRPDDERAWVGLGGVEHNTAASITAYQHALRLKPDDQNSWEFLGVEYAQIGQSQKALAALQTAQALIKPDDEKAWGSLGVFYDLAGQSKEALKCYQQALRLNPNDADVWLNLGMLYSDLRDRSGVMKVYEKLKALDPKEADGFFKDYVLPK